jgi:hypothetical protein
VIGTLSGKNLKVAATRGCPYRRVPSPLMWSLVLDELLGDLNVSGYYKIRYADDTEI